MVSERPSVLYDAVEHSVPMESLCKLQLNKIQCFVNCVLYYYLTRMHILVHTYSLCVQLASDQGILPVMGYDNYSMSFNRLQTSTEVVYQAHGSILQLTDAAMRKLRG